MSLPPAPGPGPGPGAHGPAPAPSEPESPPSRERTDVARAVPSRDAEALGRFAVAISSALDLREVFADAMAEVQSALGFDESGVLVLDESRERLRLFASTLLQGAELAIERHDPRSSAALSLERGEPITVDFDPERSELHARLYTLGLRSVLSYPLRRRGRLLGTLNLVSRTPGGVARVPASLLDSVASTIAIAVDNTLLVERLRTSERLYASLVETARESIYRLDRDGRFVYANRSCLHLAGLTQASLAGLRFVDLVHPEDARDDLLSPILSGERDELSFDLRWMRTDQTVVATSHRLHAVKDEGRTVVVQGIAADVTKEREAERGLRLHHELVEALDDYVFMADASGRLLAINRKAREALGWDLATVGGMTIWDLHPPEDMTKVERERWKILETGASSFEVHLLDKSGRKIPTRGRVTYSPQSGTFQGVYRDMTEEMLMQDRHLQVERLRSLGEMASGVAHTFNNLLAVVGTTVQVARRLNQDATVDEELRAIEQAVYDGGAAVRRIQDFVRKRPAELYGDVDLNEVVHEVERVGTHRARDRRSATPPITIETETGVLPRVRGSDSELKDVLLNLVFNAIDAMPEGGVVKLTTRAEEDRVAIEVKDTGRGMTPDVRSRIFTPFYSTKGERGSGLGLAIALNVVSQHGGTIEVVTSPGVGTTMRVLLPIAPRDASAAGPPARVLLLETEPLLRVQLARAIAREGHAVETAATPEAALALLDAKEFDSVFASVSLETDAGRSVLARAKGRGARTILLAGWDVAATEDELRQHDVDAVLRKPFPETAVLNLIHGVGA